MSDDIKIVLQESYTLDLHSFFEPKLLTIICRLYTGQLSTRVPAQGLGSLRFKSLPRHPVVEVRSSLHLAPAAHINIMLLRTVK